MFAFVLATALATASTPAPAPVHPMMDCAQTSVCTTQSAMSSMPCSMGSMPDKTAPMSRPDAQHQDSGSTPGVHMH